MKARTLSLSALLSLGAGAAVAQQATGNSRVAAAMPSQYRPPACELKAGHFKVSSGATYLKTGIETSVPENRTRALNNGERVILEAMRENDQGKNPAAWYYLGRVYLQRGDVVGADSALGKAEALAPDCRKDIAILRQMAWVPLVNAGVTFAKEENADSALALYRQANLVYRDKPQAFFNAGVLFADAGRTDSAVVYFRQALEIAERTNQAEDRNASARNLAAMLQRAERHQDAVAVFERYLDWVPNDTEVKRALATSYRATGETAKAEALERETGASPAAAGGAAAAGASALDRAVALYNEKKYAEAAAAFEQVLATEPRNRDALYGLANAAIALKDGAKLADAAERLAGLEPLNEEALKMLASGRRLAKQEVQATKAAERVLALPVNLTVTEFSRRPDGATFTGTATGREAQTATGKAIPAKQIGLVVEFLDAQGSVVANQEVPVPPLKPGETHQVSATGRGSGIVAYRYVQK